MLMVLENVRIFAHCIVGETCSMAGYHGVVSFQVYFLMVCGLWPVWKRPYGKHRTGNIILGFYSLVILMCTAYVTFQQIAQQFRLPMSSLTLIFTEITTLGDVLLKLSILHLAVFKYESIRNSLTGLTFFGQNNGRVMLVLLLFTLAIVASAIFIALNYVLTLTSSTDYLKLFSLSGYLRESQIYMILIYFVPFLNGNLIPLVLILGCASIIKKDLHLLYLVTNREIQTKNIYADESFISIKQKFYRIADVVQSVDVGFQTFMAVYVISFTVFVVWQIYTLASGCLPSSSIYFFSCYNFAGFIVLCVAGNLISSEVRDICCLSSSARNFSPGSVHKMTTQGIVPHF